MGEKRVLGYVQRVERMSEGDACWIEMTITFHIPQSYDPGDEGERVRKALDVFHLGLIEVDQK